LIAVTVLALSTSFAEAAPRMPARHPGPKAGISQAHRLNRSGRNALGRIPSVPFGSFQSTSALDRSALNPQPLPPRVQASVQNFGM